MHTRPLKGQKLANICKCSDNGLPGDILLMFRPKSNLHGMSIAL